MKTLHNPETLYNIYAVTDKTNAPDLTIGLAQYRVDHPELTQDEDVAMREFMGRHGDKLAAAYPDKGKFFQAWAEGVAEDLEAATETEDECEACKVPEA